MPITWHAYWINIWKHKAFLAHRWSWGPQTTVCRCRHGCQILLQPSRYRSGQTRGTSPETEKHKEIFKCTGEGQSWWEKIKSSVKSTQWCICLHVDCPDIKSIFSSNTSHDNRRYILALCYLIVVIQGDGLEVLQFPQIPQFQRAILGTWTKAPDMSVQSKQRQ